MSPRGWAWLGAYCLGLGGPSSLALAGYWVGWVLLLMTSVALLWGLHTTTTSAPQARGRS